MERLFLLICLNIQLLQVNGHVKPNVLFILTDDQGYRDVGYHGSLFPTPVLDKLAAEGVKLENYYVQPMCTPTRSQLMTGRYQIRTGLQHYAITPWTPDCLPTDEITLADKMRETGYSTHLVGKWHLGNYQEECLPLNRGFDSFLGFYLFGGDHFNHTGEVYGFPQNYDFHRDFDPARNYTGVYSTHAFTDEAINIINNREEDRPFFLFLSYQAPHDPLQVPEEYKEPLRDIFTDDNRLIYAAMVACLDEGVGRVVEALKDNGLYDNTVIIFTSDNGGGPEEGGINWPYRGMKGSMFEGGIKGIGFVHSPLLSGKVVGTINNEFIHVSDWFPTIIEGIAGGTTDGTKPLDGINQWKTIKYGTCSPRFELLHNIDPLTVVPGGRDWILEISPFNVSINAAIRYRDWKLITGDNGQVGWYAPPDTDYESINPPNATEQIVWLYNIRKDPLEMNDISEKNPGIVRFLLTRLQEYYMESVPVNFPTPEIIEANPCQNGNNCVWGPWAMEAVSGIPT